MKSIDHPLRLFLCHASQDKPAVRELYKRLKSEPWLDPWLDEERLLPGQDWDLEIYKAIREADAIIVCLSKESVTKEGYVQKEFKRALNLAEEKPEGTIYIIPLRLDDCQPPMKFQQYQWVDYFSAGAQEKLLKALRIRFDRLKLKSEASNHITLASKPLKSKTISLPKKTLDLYRFVKIASHAVPKPFWIAKYPVTNAQYERFLKSDDFANPDFWINFPKFDQNCTSIGDWGNAGLEWLKEKLKDYEFFPPRMFKVKPRDWNSRKFRIAKPDNPVVGITWFEANAYCRWLAKHWGYLQEFRANPGLNPSVLRLPLETEWIAAAGGEKPEGRYPWDLPGKATTDEKDIVRRANVAGKIGHTTPVTTYQIGKSPFGVMDMAGNIWEWQANLYDDKEEDLLAGRGGSWYYHYSYACVSIRRRFLLHNGGNLMGFRVVAFDK